MRPPAPNVDLRPDHWDIVRRVLHRHVPHREVLAFGSRATWTAKEYSDLDLAIMGEEPLPLNTAAALAEDLCESDLPFKVDIVDWARTDDSFRAIIRRNGVAVYAPPPSQTSGETPPSLPILRGTAERREARDGARTPKRPEHCLGDIADLNWGDTKTTKKSYTSVGFPAYSAAGQDGLLPYHDFDRTGVVLSAIGAKCGRTWLVKGKWSCIKNTIRFWSISSDADTEYLYWLTRDPDFWPKRGSAQAFISQGDARAIRIALPGIDEQRAIAHILGTLDDKIELNRRMNETLEAMVRALFKSWFVDFDPVRAKMEGRGTGLPPDIADLFPDRLADCEIGEIPEGWEAKSLKDCMNLTMGQSPPGSTYNNHGDGLPFFQGQAEFGFRYPEKRRFCSAPTRVADPEDTLVSVWAPVGNINLAWERCCIGRGVAALRHKSGSSSFTYHSAWALRREFEEYEHTGTVFGAINKGQFEALKVTEPDPRVVEAFDTMAVNLDARIRSNIRESHILAALRDTLLPELVSGEVRLRDAKSFGPDISFNTTRVPG